MFAEARNWHVFVGEDLNCSRGGILQDSAPWINELWLFSVLTKFVNAMSIFQSPESQPNIDNPKD